MVCIYMLGIGTLESPVKEPRRSTRYHAEPRCGQQFADPLNKDAETLFNLAD